MAKQRRNYNRGSYLPLALMGVTLVGFLGLAGLSVAWISGYFEDDRQQSVDRTGQLAFPALARPVAAFESLTKDDFINPNTNQLNVVWLLEATAEVATRSMSDLIGRVLKRDKAEGLVLSEGDFLERGTRPGLAAGVPVGKVALSIPATNIPGLEQLRNGDRFDLMVSLPMPEGDDPISNTEPAALFGGVKAPSLRVGQLSRQHGVKQLVTGGMLVTLFKGAERSTTGQKGLTVTPSRSSRSSKTAPDLFAELAIDAEEIGPLTEAIGLGTKMTCVVRSGQPSEKAAAKFNVEGMVPVITTAKTVEAFSQLSDENLIDESTGQLHLYYFPADKVADSWIVDPTDLYGRVVARSVRRGAFLTEADLLPPGTRPGISAGLPPGMSAMSISKANIQGFEQLAVGDRFSILTRVPDAVAGGAPITNWATIQGGRMPEDDARVADMMRTGIREIAKDAIFLSAPDEATVVIGIPEQSVPSLAQLLRDDSDVFVVASSSRTNEQSSSSPFPISGKADIPFSELATHSASHHSSVGRVMKEKPISGSVGEHETVVISTRSTAQSGTTRFVHQLDSSSDSNLTDEVAVPILVENVTAFDELEVGDLIDPSTGRIRTLLFPRNAIKDDWVLDPKRLIDRVANRNLRAGRPVSATDLAPIGTEPGPSAGLPPGTRGITVNSRQIIGLEILQPGSKFDIISASALDVDGLADSTRQSLASSDAVREAAKLPSGRVSNSRTVLRDAMLLADLGEATIVVPTGGNTNGGQTQTRLTADGSTVTETVTIEPVSTSELAVQRYVLAVPENLVGSVLGLLDIQNPLFVSLRPWDVGPSSDARSQTQPATDAAVRAVIQEHVRGQDITSEVFLTDRVEPVAISYPGAFRANDSAGSL